MQQDHTAQVASRPQARRLQPEIATSFSSGNTSCHTPLRRCIAASSDSGTGVVSHRSPRRSRCECRWNTREPDRVRPSRSRRRHERDTGQHPRSHRPPLEASARLVHPPTCPPAAPREFRVRRIVPAPRGQSAGVTNGGGPRMLGVANTLRWRTHSSCSTFASTASAALRSS